jgi:hypothetical protein
MKRVQASAAVPISIVAAQAIAPSRRNPLIDFNLQIVVEKFGRRQVGVVKSSCINLPPRT